MALRWRWPSSASPKEYSSFALRCGSAPLASHPPYRRRGPQHNHCCGVEQNLTGFETTTLAERPQYLAPVIGGVPASLGEAAPPPRKRTLGVCANTTKGK